MPNAKNILTGTSRLFIGTAGVDVLPADTVAFGGSWGGTWRDVGYTTDDGVTVGVAQTFNPVRTAQDPNPVLQIPGDTDDTVAATLQEATLQNIKDATGRGAIASVAPVGATPGHDELTLSAAAAIRYVAVGFEGVAPPNDKGNPRRIFMPYANATANVSMNQRITQPVGIPVQFSRLGGTGNDLKIRDVTTT